MALGWEKENGLRIYVSNFVVSLGIQITAKAGWKTVFYFNAVKAEFERLTKVYVLRYLSSFRVAVHYERCIHLLSGNSLAGLFPQAVL